MPKFEVTFALSDANEQVEEKLKVTLAVNERGIEVRFDGYGDFYSQPGRGAPLWIEVRNGVPFVVAWSMITAQSPTHQISLEEAKERRPKEEG